MRRSRLCPPTSLRPVLLLAVLLATPACGDDGSGDPCKDVERSCDTAGSTSCADDIIQTCADNGEGCLVWQDTSMCPAGLACFGGSCVCDDECSPDSNQCHGNTIQHCASTLEGCLYWQDVLDCEITDMSCDDTEDATCVEGAGCGNDILESPEICDGTDLGETDCVSLGFGPGMLACSANCRAFDTSGCTPSADCGDGVIEPPEVCDGSELGNADCVTQGFHGGTLACRANCGAYDTSGCTGFCGDGGVNGPEQCDLNDLGGQTCELLGFYEGTLACDASCLYDTSGCSGTCGDGVASGPEVCDGTDVGLMTCQDFGFVGGDLECLPACDDLDLSQCVSPWTVDDCWISAPVPSLSAPEYTVVPVFGRVWITGLTDQATGPDEHVLLVADVGVGPDGSNPSQDLTGWTWYPALPNFGFTHATVDEYFGDLQLPPAAGSPYDYAYRFSVDGGQTWTYCDRTDATYTPSDSGDLIVTN